MTLAEKLALPAGPELDRVIAEDLLGWKWPPPEGFLTFTVWESGWRFFYKWLITNSGGGCMEQLGVLIERWNGEWFASITRDDKYAIDPTWGPKISAPTPLLAAWRAALAWNHARKETT